MASDSNSCPLRCRCGTYDGVNTVDCSSERLVTIETEISTQAQLLDLSLNNIMEIGVSEFCVR